MTLEKVLKEIEKVALEESIPIVGPIKGKFLGELVRKQKPQRALEIGTAIGYSAIIIAKNLPPAGKLETLEINPSSASLAKSYLQKAGLSSKVSVMVGDALQIIPTLPDSYDFAFIDARKGDYYIYLKMLEKKIITGSLIVADNVKIFASSMQDYLDEVRTSPRFKTKTVDFGFDAFEVSLFIP